MSSAKLTPLAGFWQNNAALVQLLGLCPLLAVTTTVVNGLTLGLATMAVVMATNTVISLLRNSVAPIVRIPMFVLVIAALVTCIDLLTHALFYDLHETLGLFIPLIITNCAILAQAETVASRNPLAPSLVSGAATGAGFCVVLVALGALREVVGSGSLLSGLEMLVGEGGEALALDLPFDGMLAAALPPGAFFGLAVLLALRNLFNDRMRARELARQRAARRSRAA